MRASRSIYSANVRTAMRTSYNDEVKDDNYHEALKAYESLGSPESLKLVFVYTLQDAIDYLYSLGEQDA